MKGGKREGAGRPTSSNPATKLVTIKMTPQEHQAFLERGGSRWVKRMLATQGEAKMKIEISYTKKNGVQVELENVKPKLDDIELASVIEDAISKLQNMQLSLMPNND